VELKTGKGSAVLDAYPKLAITEQTYLRSQQTACLIETIAARRS